MAPQGLAGLGRDHFANGRLFATVGAHGGLLNLSYWGRQHLGAAEFFHGDPGTAWIKLFRPCIGMGDRRFYLTLNKTRLYPFGLESQCEVNRIELKHELLLLPDALVQRFRTVRNPKRLPVLVEMFHQERFTATNRENRTWSDFEYDSGRNVLVAACTDENPTIYRGGDELSQAGAKLELQDAPHAITWIGVGSNARIKVRFSHKRTKLYVTSEPLMGKNISFFVVFAATREELECRLKQLSKTVDKECDDLVHNYQTRLKSRPRIDVGNPILNSAFTQFPEVIETNKLSDRAGAVRATASGYFVWGWDGLTPVISSTLSNESKYAAAILRFMQQTCHPAYGIPHAYTTDFQLKFKGPFPSQAQFIASLYHYIAATGDLALAREMMPTCRFILDRCRENIVDKTGLVSGNALWPDFPEVMEEDGHDISSMNNSLLYQGLRAMEYIARVLGDPQFADECRDWSRNLHMNFVKFLYDEAKGYFISSCSSRDFKPRKHYGCQVIFWLTPFARELVSHAPARIAAFMNQHLRAEKCLLSLPTWDTVWMGDGNQLGSSFPSADYFYLNVNKLVGNGAAMECWLGDVEWFWRYHTAPEAFTPEAENEGELGPDNTGCKQTQALTAWYACLYHGVAGIDMDHEGLTFTPWGDRPVKIRGVELRGTSIDLTISGRGSHVGSLRLNGKLWPRGSRKISWNDLRGKRCLVELVRSETMPGFPVIVRADGLNITGTTTKRGHLSAFIDAQMSGEIVVQTGGRARIRIDGKPVKAVRDASTSTYSIPYEAGKQGLIEVLS